jgi:hypothetical protein
MAKKKTADDLIDFIQVLSSIECSKCKAADCCWMADEFSASESLFKKGWRATQSNIYCPKCAKKHLKSLEK